MQLLLGFIQFPELLRLSFTQLFTFSIMSGETLKAQGMSLKTCLIHICYSLGLKMFTVSSNLEYLSVSVRNISQAEIFILASFAI